MRTHRTVLLLALTLALAGIGLPSRLGAEEASTARLTFIKVFKGSQPEYTRISVEDNGQGFDPALLQRQDGRRFGVRQPA